MGEDGVEVDRTECEPTRLCAKDQVAGSGETAPRKKWMKREEARSTRMLT